MFKYHVLMKLANRCVSFVHPFCRIFIANHEYLIELLSESEIKGTQEGGTGIGNIGKCLLFALNSHRVTEKIIRSNAFIYIMQL